MLFLQSGGHFIGAALSQPYHARCYRIILGRDGTFLAWIQGLNFLVFDCFATNTSSTLGNSEGVGPLLCPLRSQQGLALY